MKNKMVMCFLIWICILLLTACGQTQTAEAPEPVSNDVETSQVEADTNDSNDTTASDMDSDSMDSDVMDKDPLKIYISADRTGTKESGIAIEQGIVTALSEVENQLQGRPVEVLVLDHRGSTPRANEHLEMYLADDNALALFSGLHSPPLLASRDYINENQILVLDPWAAAGPITRYPSEENWIFRLSVDDTKAGQLITDYAVKNEGFKKPYLLLEETGWGTSNEKNMKAALENYEIKPSETAWFNWNLGKNQAKLLLREAKNSGADVIFFVGNAPEGKVFATAMSELSEEERLPIRSHWGITGGDFPSVIDADIRSKIDLKFIQTSFSFMDMDEHLIGKDVFEKAMVLFPETIEKPADISAPTGFSHSYDLTKLLISAVNQVDLDEEVTINRQLVRKSLENIESPIVGLVKTYEQPFSMFTEDNPDAHEALGIEDLRMAMYGENNEIILLD